MTDRRMELTLVLSHVVEGSLQLFPILRGVP
jgi:hypothetical protein